MLPSCLLEAGPWETRAVGGKSGLFQGWRPGWSRELYPQSFNMLNTENSTQRGFTGREKTRLWAGRLPIAQSFMALGVSFYFPLTLAVEHCSLGLTRVVLCTCLSDTPQSLGLLRSLYKLRTSPCQPSGQSRRIVLIYTQNERLKRAGTACPGVRVPMLWYSVRVPDALCSVKS